MKRILTLEEENKILRKKDGNILLSDMELAKALFPHHKPRKQP
jgi:hypothetical protein